MKEQPKAYENLYILVVEEDEGSYLLIEEFSANYKPHLIHFKNFEEALLNLNSTTILNLAIIDVKLPHLDGLELVSVIQQRDQK